MLVFYIYLSKLKKESNKVAQKIAIAKEDGIHEPVSLYPSINEDICIKSGACAAACPEKDILGIQNGRAVLVNASSCVGHGACFHACPVEAITLKIGTDKRGVDLPHINQNFETNIKGIYIAGELGGMGLIKNSVEQGKQAIENIHKSLKPNNNSEIYDVVIVGAGPAGISASLQAKSLGLRSITLEQDSLGGTVFSFPRSKVVMTAPMNLPGHGKVKLYKTSKTELLNLWQTVLKKNNLTITENTKVENIQKKDGLFHISCNGGKEYKAQSVLLAIGRRGTPRKLGIPGENLEKVAYTLREPENISGKNIMVVGGGDSAIESALLLAENNNVTLSYRGEAFSRLKVLNRKNIEQAILHNTLHVILRSQVKVIHPQNIEISINDGETLTLENELIFIFAGGELPTPFLQKIGIEISKRFNYTLLSH